MKQRLLTVLLGAYFLVSASRMTLAQNNGVQVNVDPFGQNILNDAANEPSIAVDPNNPNRIAIGWRQFDTITSNFRQAGVAFSTNGGQTWTADTLDPGQFRSDPVLDYDAAGNFYYSSLSSTTTVEVFKSTNGGATWSDPPVPAFGGDKQWIAVDRSGGMGHGNLYQHWNVQFSGVPNTSFTRSIDGGASFQAPLAGPVPYMRSGTMDVGPDGTLYFAGTTLDRTAHLFSKSLNAQNPAQTPTFTASQSINLGGPSVRGAPMNPDGLLGQVWISTDHSQTASHGNVYVLSSVNPAGADPLDITLIRSSDGGNTWTPPIRINNDLPAANAYQWFGTMSVAPNGRIDVVWNDTRNDASFSTSQLFYGYSLDAGTTWLGNKPLSAPFNHNLGYPNQLKIGDYYDTISDGTGVHVAYAATFTGGQDIYYLRINTFDACDFDGNQTCDIVDLNDLLAEGPISGGVSVTPGMTDHFDMTGDGLIDLDDRDAWLALAASQDGLLSPYKLGDANLDGNVDGVDFNRWNSNKFTMSLDWDRGNFNGDAAIDGSDFSLWSGNKFTSSSRTSSVPEPGVMFPGLLLMMMLRGYGLKLISSLTPPTPATRWM